ncbi:hypothetical protein [Gordonia alkanivorans]|uniref:hypothetical protein n=1 Tax=Gordonia alkanivorans TaxID=84096 RepID=UPI0004B04FE5|nr:hypothetical protein [Gordonia alkanivorans]
MATNISVLAAEGASGLTSVINNLAGTVKVVGAAAVILVIAAVAVMMMFGAFSSNGSMRQHINKIAIAFGACLLLGAGGFLGETFIGVGEEAVGNNPPSQQQGAE